MMKKCREEEEEEERRKMKRYEVCQQETYEEVYAALCAVYEEEKTQWRKKTALYAEMTALYAEEAFPEL